MAGLKSFIHDNYIHLSDVASPGSNVLVEILCHPIHNPVNKNIAYLELLSRAVNDSGQYVNPFEFFSYPEDEILYEIVKNQIKYIRNINVNIHTSINITLKSLLNDKLYELLIYSKNKPIIIEISDFSLPSYSSEKLIITRIKTLQKKGIDFWIDNFSHDNSEILNFMHKIIWDYIKIDHSYLVYNSMFTEDLQALLNVVKPHTHKGFILKGVDLDIHAQFSRKNSHLVQGYYFSSPGDFSLFTTKIEKNYYAEISTTSNTRHFIEELHFL